MTDPGAAARLARLADGYLATQLLYAAVALGLPRRSPPGRAGDDLARELGAVPGLLHRVLRGLRPRKSSTASDSGSLTGRRAPDPGGARSLRDISARRSLQRPRPGRRAGRQEHALRIVHGLPRAPGRDSRRGEQPSVHREPVAQQAGRSSPHIDVRAALVHDISGKECCYGIHRAPHADLVLFDRPEVVAVDDPPGRISSNFSRDSSRADLYALPGAGLGQQRRRRRSADVPRARRSRVQYYASSRRYCPSVP